MRRLDRKGFERLVRQALEELPEEFAERIENVAVVVEVEPSSADLEGLGLDFDESSDDLFGLYVGTPLTERDSYYAGLPDRIVIYMGPILRACQTPRDVVSEIRKTVIHEIGHHFGLSDEEMPY
ncbi:MAG: metallopeptidase family protein [Gemmatimonadota bacterium]|nr:MAG: metallopeptidase family protein [Gemmatimonadota bacterium]